MAMNPGIVEEEISGIPTFEPSFHLPAIWITENQRERVELSEKASKLSKENVQFIISVIDLLEKDKEDINK